MHSAFCRDHDRDSVCRPGSLTPRTDCIVFSPCLRLRSGCGFAAVSSPCNRSCVYPTDDNSTHLRLGGSQSHDLRPSPGRDLHHRHIAQSTGGFFRSLPGYSNILPVLSPAAVLFAMRLSGPTNIACSNLPVCVPVHLLELTMKNCWNKSRPPFRPCALFWWLSGWHR